MKKITEKEFIEITKDFSDIQQQLVCAYLALTKNEKNWPKHGVIKINQESWGFKKHGAGVCFTKCATGELIDAHDDMEKSPRKLDAWRIQNYLSSIEEMEIELLGKHYHSHNDDDIEELLRTCHINN
ncbi:DUF6896 domain-containing protein [Pseudomonas oryziphila]|uniref:DUF6896 domain-containing protein n=1 Tax=Pseudomonas entomophila TaxID=312306 RepID=A0A3Q8TZZ4_9PSED|nr:hypothetical protein [Pseudomonas oryziphila]AZL67507.1 hypothetical protein EJA05_07005 [Pseudomonas oryziphila]